MTAASKRHVTALTCAVAWMLAASCGHAPPAAPGPAPAPAVSVQAAAPAPEPPDGPVPALRTGALAPTDDPAPVAARVARRYLDAKFETLLVEFEQEPESGGVDVDGLVVSISPAGLFSFATQYGAGIAERGRRNFGAPPPFYVWARRPASAAGTPLAGEIFLAAASSLPGKRLHFRAEIAAGTKSDPSLAADWMQALAGRLSGGPFQAFASARLGEIARQKKPSPARRITHTRPIAPARVSDELATLMETTTGAIAIQEALQHDRSLFLTSTRQPASVLLSSLSGPKLARQPWSEMLKRLGTPVPPEPLAAAAPADFYYVRASGITVLLRLLDQIDAWGTPAAQIVGGDAEDHDLMARYSAELGLERGPLTSVFGPAVVAELGLVGSDPYVKEGSDVTVLFRVKNQTLFDSALQAALANHAQSHGAITSETLSLAGVDVKVARSADGVVRQHRASVGDLAFVSNSPGALKRVLETVQGKGPKLADELDFQYMLARDASTKADGIAYMSDRFVAEVVGPRQKIAEARRQVALAELMTPGFAALLYGWVNGKSPASVDEVVGAGLLARQELSHAGGGAITWRPGETARSPWGTPAALTPLADIAAPERVTEAERAGYERFARSYEYDWATYIDPVAVRFAMEPVSGPGASTRMTIDLRELPLLDATKYRTIGEQVGAARFEVSPIGVPGVRAVVGIGEHSWLREATSHLQSFSEHHTLKFEWLGDWAMVGMLDRSRLASVALDVSSANDRDLLQPPPEKGHGVPSDDDLVADLVGLPAYAAIGIRSPVGAALALAGLRAIASETVPGLVDWGESGTHRGVSIVRVALSRQKAREEFGKDVAAQLFYAITDGAILLALSEPVLRGLIDDRLEGKGPKPPADKGGGTQFAIDLAGDRGGGLWITFTWLLESEILRDHKLRSRATAEGLLHGAPERAADAAAIRSLALAYFGSVPLAPDGGAFTLGPDGLKDPARGTAYAPAWPAVPVPGSPVDAVMGAFARARTEVSFDDEGRFGRGGPDAAPLRSLHARVTLDLR
jgi:hypothetical protein